MVNFAFKALVSRDLPRILCNIILHPCPAMSMSRPWPRVPGRSLAGGCPRLLLRWRGHEWIQPVHCGTQTRIPLTTRHGEYNTWQWLSRYVDKCLSILLDCASICLVSCSLQGGRSDAMMGVIPSRCYNVVIIWRVRTNTSPHDDQLWLSSFPWHQVLQHSL